MGDFRYYQYYQPLKVGNASDAALLEGALPSAPPAGMLLGVGTETAQLAHGMPAASRSFHIYLARLLDRVTVMLVVTIGGKAIATGCVGYGVLHVAALSGVDQASITFAAAAVLFGIDARLSFIGALMLLIEVALLQRFGYIRYSDALAVAAFYALAVGVVMAIVEYAKDSRREPDVTYRLRR